VENTIRGKDDIPETVKEDQAILNSIAVSSAEAERSFPLMNTICDDKRSSLIVRHICDLMRINLIGQPTSTWDPKLYVKSSLKSATQLIIQRLVTERRKKNGNQKLLWKILEESCL
jgi:hypothetical protein